MDAMAIANACDARVSGIQTVIGEDLDYLLLQLKIAENSFEATISLRADVPHVMGAKPATFTRDPHDCNIQLHNNLLAWIKVVSLSVATCFGLHNAVPLPASRKKKLPTHYLRSIACQT